MSSVSERTCNLCGENKSLSEYYKQRKKNSEGEHYHYGQCRDCYNARQRVKRLNRPLEQRQAEHLAARLKKDYNLTVDQYMAMVEAQGGKCRICMLPDPTGINLSVDHDHKCCPGRKSCGKCIRGLLCRPCNTAIGLLREDEKRLRAAIQYLTESRP